MKKIIVFFILTLSIFLYYFFDTSYRLSLESKAYYEFGEYTKAKELAEKAYKLNKYNRMAFTILTQSKIAETWQNYIKDSTEYLFEIESISNKEVITKADKIKIKMMLEVIIGEFNNLPKSKLLDKELQQKAKKNYMEAMNLYNGIFKSRK
jgi:tetratricopeptide (TPR) repeat protein